MSDPGSSAESRILLHATADGVPLRLAPATSLRLAGPARWLAAPLRVEHQILGPADTPDVTMREFLVTVHGRPHVLRAAGDAERRVHRLETDDVLFKSAHTAGRYSWAGPVDALNVALDPAFVQQVAERELQQDATGLATLRAGPDPTTRHLVRAVAAEIAAGEPNGRLFLEATATALVAHLVRRHMGQRATDPVPAVGLSSRDVRAVHDYVRLNIANDIRLVDLATLVNLSPYHFARSFKSSTGQTPHQYVTHIRVELARDLLMRPALSIAEVTRRSGFANGSHLARFFRRATGTSPSAYRNAARRHTGPVAPTRAEDTPSS